jgi:hypothetical protein
MLVHGEPAVTRGVGESHHDTLPVGIGSAQVTRGGARAHPTKISGLDAGQLDPYPDAEHLRRGGLDPSPGETRGAADEP